MQNLDKLRTVVDKIKSGEYKHNQKCYHSDCGTSHCIAGWLQIQYLKEKDINSEDMFYEEKDNNWFIFKEFNDKYFYGEGSWDWAADYLDIEYSESEALFSADLDIDQIDIHVGMMERGENVLESNYFDYD